MGLNLRTRGALQSLEGCVSDCAPKHGGVNLAHQMPHRIRGISNAACNPEDSAIHGKGVEVLHPIWVGPERALCGTRRRLITARLWGRMASRLLGFVFVALMVFVFHSAREEKRQTGGVGTTAAVRR